MIKKLKQFFQLNNWKRWFILGFTSIVAILAIVFGSSFFVVKNVNKSIEYGGGVEVLVQVLNNDKKPLDASKEDNRNLVNTVSDSMHSRLSGGTGINGTKTSVEGDGKIRITKNGLLTEAQTQEFIKDIVNKPTLVLTDTNMRPLFYQGSFNTKISDEKAEINKIDYSKLYLYSPPIKSGSAKQNIDQTGGNYISVGLEQDDNKTAEREWSKATDYISKHGTRKVLMWLNLDRLKHLAETKFSQEWENAKHNLYNFVYVDEKPSYGTNGFSFANQNDKNQIKTAVLKEKQFNAKKYLVSEAYVSQALNSDSFTITGKFTQEEAIRLAMDINYGTAKYNLQFLSSSWIVPNSSNTSNFNSAIAAGIVVFVIIAIFMIWNYGLLGVLSTLSIALYMFLTLLLFASLNGEYSPATIAALVIGIGISVDANIITYERLKNEISNGDGLVKATRNAHRFSLSSILDANIATLIVSIILFYFGTITIKSFSISLMLSIFFTLLIMLIFNKMMATLLVNISSINKKLWLFGIYNFKLKPKSNVVNKTSNKVIFYKRIDYIKLSNWLFIISFSVIVILIIVFGSIAIAKNNVGAAFNLSLDFSGGTKVIVETGENGDNISLGDANASANLRTANGIKNTIINFFSGHNIDIANDISFLKKDSHGKNYAVVLQTSKNVIEFLNESASNLQNTLRNTYSQLNITNYSISNVEATNLIKNALLAIGIAFVGIIIYTLVRMRWTYSIAAIIALLHDTLLVIGSFIIFRLELSPIIVAAILSIVAFSINDTIVIFDRIREILNTEYANYQLNKSDLRKIINKAIGETIKRSIFTSVTTIVTVIVLLIFKDATEITFNIAMLIGLVIGTYSSIFIATQIWYRLETWRQKGIQKRIKNNYWNINKPGEQIFPGINDFQH